MTKKHNGKRIAAALAAMLILSGCGVSGRGGTSSSAALQMEIEKEYARFPHFQNQKVTEENHILTLTNWKKSPFDLVYTLSSAGEVIYESPVLEPGEKLEWDILAYCDRSCDLEITATAFTQEGKEQNSVTQSIRLKLPAKKEPQKAPQVKTKEKETDREAST